MTAKDVVTVASAAGQAALVSRGETNRTTQVLTFSAPGGAGLVTDVQVTGAVGGLGTLAGDVTLVKIYNDNGSVANAYDATDTLLGSAIFNGSGVANVNITDTKVPAAGSVRMLVTFDISASATYGDSVGSQLTAVTTAVTDNLTTTLPQPSSPAYVLTVFNPNAPEAKLFVYDVTQQKIVREIVPLPKGRSTSG